MTAAAPSTGAAVASHHATADFIKGGKRVLKGEAFSPAELDVPSWQVRSLEQRKLIAVGPASERLQLEAMERREKLEQAPAEKVAPPRAHPRRGRAKR